MGYAAGLLADLDLGHTTIPSLREDGDLTSDLFTFQYEPEAAEPEPITIDVGGVDTFGWFDWVLLIAAAAVLGYLVHRIVWAWRGHRAAPATESAPT